MSRAVFGSIRLRRRTLWPALLIGLVGVSVGAGAAAAATVTEFRAGVSAQGAPEEIVAGPDGNMWFTEWRGDRVGRVTPAGTVTEFSAGIAWRGSPQGIAAGPDGNLWFAEPFSGVGRITPAGKVTEFSQYSTAITSGGGPLGIAAGPDGNLWFTEAFGGRLARITPAGVVTEFSAGLTPRSGPAGIALGADGNLWFTEFDVDQIGRITPAGKVKEFSAGRTTEGGPDGIAAGPDGNIWFTEFDAGRVGRITPGGTVTLFSKGITPGSGPQRITAGPDGNLWFTERTVFSPHAFDGDRVARITPSGRITEFSAGIAPDSDPGGIAAGPDGNLWFTERNAIGRITTASGPVLAVLTRRARVSAGGAINVRLSCGAGSGRCAGRLVLTTTIRARVRVSAHSRRFITIPQRITLATARFSLAAARRAPVRLTLGRAARRRLARAAHGHLPAQARAVSHGGDGWGRLMLTAPAARLG